MSSGQPTNWLFRVGNGVELFNSSVFNIWGINSLNSDSKFFLRKANPGDCLWFVKGNSNGLIVAVAIFERSVKRVCGECMTYEQLGWTNFPGLCETDIHFKNFKKIENLNLKSQIKSPKVVRKYNEKCLVNLPEMYSRFYHQEEEFIRVRRFSIEGFQYLKAANGNIYDIESQEFIGTYIDGVFTRNESDEDNEEDEDVDPEITEQQVCVNGVNYLVTTNADVKDENTMRFIDSLVSSEESSDEEDTSEELCEEKESLRRILSACTIISNEINQLTSLLNNRLAKL
jgi:hypothetical protein